MSRIYEVRLVGDGKSVRLEVYGKRGRYRHLLGALKMAPTTPADLKAEVDSIIARQKAKDAV